MWLWNDLLKGFLSMQKNECEEGCHGIGPWDAARAARGLWMMFLSIDLKTVHCVAQPV